MANRSYTSKTRAATALETRAAILHAAEDLFGEQGYAAATVAGIAARAGVAQNTLYTSVGGKSALLEELVREVSEEDEITIALAAVQDATDGRDILRRTAEGVADVSRRHEKILNVLLDNATADPGVGAMAERAVERYRRRLVHIAGHLVELKAVHTGVVRTEQILWFYFGPGAWRTLRGLGWAWTESTVWLTEQAAGALLDRAPTRTQPETIRSDPRHR